MTEIQKMLSVFILSMVPLYELKGGIIQGAVLQLPLWQDYFVALLGSCLPVPFILLLLNWVLGIMKKVSWLAWFPEWLEKRAFRKNATVEKYGLLGLFTFVAIPLPMTGVWMGSAIATFMGFDRKKSFALIVLGNVVAGLLILALTSLGIMALKR